MTALGPVRLFRNEKGAAIIELALVAPIMALMVIGIIDMSNAFSRKLALEQGAQRAIEKIMQTTELDTVENTLKNEVQCQVNGVGSGGSCNTSPVATSDISVTYKLECNASGGAITTQSNTDPVAFDALTCPSGTVSEARYIEVVVNDVYRPMFPIHFSFINPDQTYHLSATAGMRTE